MQHDHYRPAGWHFLKGGVDASASSSRGAITSSRGATGAESARSPDNASIGPSQFPASFVPELLVRASTMPLAVPTGALRAPGSNAYSCVFQSFIDELAARGRQGSAAVPSRPARPAARHAEGRAAATTASIPNAHSGVSATGRPRNPGGARRSCPQGTGMGIAFQFSHRGYLAQVAEVRGEQQGARQGQQGLGRGGHRQPDHQPEQRRESGAGRGDRRPQPHDVLRDHVREGRVGAEQLPRLPAGADGAGATGHRSAFPGNRQPGHRPRRAGAAADPAGRRQRDLRGERQARSGRCRSRRAGSPGRKSRGFAVRSSQVCRFVLRWYPSREQRTTKSGS